MAVWVRFCCELRLGNVTSNSAAKSVYFHELSNFLLPEEISARPICDLWHPHPSAPSVGNFIFSEDAQKGREFREGRKEALHLLPRGSEPIWMKDDCNGRALISEESE